MWPTPSIGLRRETLLCLPKISEFMSIKTESLLVIGNVVPMLAFHFITKVEKRLVGVSESRAMAVDSGIRGAYSRGYYPRLWPVGACCGVIGISM